MAFTLSIKVQINPYEFIKRINKAQVKQDKLKGVRCLTIINNNWCAQPTLHLISYLLIYHT